MKDRQKEKKGRQSEGGGRHGGLAERQGRECATDVPPPSERECAEWTGTPSSHTYSYTLMHKLQQHFLSPQMDGTTQANSHMVKSFVDLC